MARVAGAMAAPLRQLAGLFQALPRNLACGLHALIDERGGPPQTVEEGPPAAAQAPEGGVAPAVAATAETAETEKAQTQKENSGDG
ncbi:MAG: hypothetical protein ABSH04_00965 [Acidimicrobiales bacterium]